MSPIILSLLPVLVLLAFRTLCTLRPAPVPTYLEKKARRTDTYERWLRRERT
jgi:hypothetical protein